MKKREKGWRWLESERVELRRRGVVKGKRKREEVGRRRVEGKTGLCKKLLGSCSMPKNFPIISGLKP